MHYCTYLSRNVCFSVIAKVLLQNKADADCKDRKEWTPLHHAAAQDNAECVKLLLKYKADIDSQGACGWTPLMMAAKYGNVEAVVVFLEQEAKIGLLNDDGETFFDIAIDSNQDAVCKAVLECDRYGWLFTSDVSYSGQIIRGFCGYGVKSTFPSTIEYIKTIIQGATREVLN